MTQAEANRIIHQHNMGDFIMEFPSNLTLDDYSDVEEWFQIILRGLKRRAIANTPAEKTAEPWGHYQ